MNNMQNVAEMIQQSTITCPVCSYAQLETMSTDSCQWFYECERCKALLRPKPGDCCVFCSFGSANCPSMQGWHPCCKVTMAST